MAGTGSAASSSMNKAFPVKNTFIHFDITDDDVRGGPEPGPQEKEASGNSADSEQFVYWLPSFSSSSNDSSRRKQKQRPASVDCGRSSSSSDREYDLVTLKGQIAQMRDEHKKAKDKEDSSGELFTVAGGSGSNARQAPAPKQDALEEASPAEGSRGADWSNGLMGMFRGLWESGWENPMAAGGNFAGGAGAAASSSSAAAAPPTLHALAKAQPEMLLERVPRNEAGELTSLGSTGHEDGKCTPCPFWFKGVCLNGVACRHCHFAHEGQRPRRLRPSKQGRERLRRRMEQEQEGGEPPAAQGPAGAQAAAGYSQTPSSFAANLAQAVEKAGLKVADPPRMVAKQQMSL